MISERPEARAMLSVLKVAGGSRLEVVICSEKVFGFASHWVVNRSYLCGGPECPACAGGLQSRWHGFYPVILFDDEGRKVRLLELPASSFDRFSGLCRMEQYSSPRGILCSVSRRKANSPLRVDPVGLADGCKLKTLDERRVWSAIGVLYGLPQVGHDESPAEWSERCRVMVCSLLSGAIRKFDI